MSGETPLVSLNEVKHTEDETVLFLKKKKKLQSSFWPCWPKGHLVIRNLLSSTFLFSAPRIIHEGPTFLRLLQGQTTCFLSRNFWCCVRILQKVLYSLSTTGVEREGHRQLLGDMKFLPCLSFCARSMSSSLACSGNPCDVHVVKGLPL